MGIGLQVVVDSYWNPWKVPVYLLCGFHLKKSESYLRLRAIQAWLAIAEEEVGL